jgi:hypothetical protein
MASSTAAWKAACCSSLISFQTCEEIVRRSKATRCEVSAIWSITS